MGKTVAEVMTASVLTVDTQDSLDQVEQTMGAHHLTSVPVVDAKGAIFGVISACDLVRFHNLHKNFKALRAWEMCTYKPMVADPEVTAAEVARLMVKKRIHHVVVVKEGAIQGVVSSLDLIERCLLEEESGSPETAGTALAEADGKNRTEC